MDIDKIKKLRSETGYPVSHIKDALIKFDGDTIKAKDYLSSLIKKETSNRVASKGIVSVYIKSNLAVIFELTAETDFAKDNPRFQKLTDEIKEALIDSDATTLDDLHKFIYNKHTIFEHIRMRANQIQENIYLRRYEKIYKQDHQSFLSYVHPDGKNACLLILNIAPQDAYEDLAMHAVAMDALFISKDHLTPQDLEILKKEYQELPGFAQSFDAYLEEKSLYSQPYIKTPSMTIETLLSMHHAQVKFMRRYTLGEGISHKLMCKLDLTCGAKPLTVIPTIKR